MVEKFNFYDIYGYLFPGLVFCVLIWIPFGLLLHSWPTQELASAILALILSYFVGHLIQTFAMELFASTIKDDESSRDRYPSDLILDENRPPLTRDTKRKIEELSLKYLGIPLGIQAFPVEHAELGEKGTQLKQAAESVAQLEKEIREIVFDLTFKGLPESEELKKKRTELNLATENVTKLQAQIKKIDERVGQLITGNRKDAFFQARSALLRDKKPSYWEQFEGLYAMMRGLSAALAASSAYFLGWAVGLWRKLGDPASLLQSDVWSLRARWVLLILGTALIITAIWNQFRKRGRKKKTGELSVEQAHGEKKQGQQSPAWLQPTMRGLLLSISLLAGFLLALGIIYPPPHAQKQPCVSSLISIVTCDGGKNASEDSGNTNGITASSFVMFLLSLVAIVASTRCFGAYKSFAWSFAEHVWRDFANLEAKWSTSKSGDSAA